MNEGRKTTVGTRRARIAGLLLVALVILPGLVLGWMAIRAADPEEAVIEKQLRTAILAEVNPAADRIAELLAALQSELGATAPDSAALDGDSGGEGRLAVLDDWARSSALIGVPFLFQRSTARFLWPRDGYTGISGAESDFLKLNLDFFQDRKSVLLFQNVAVQYADRAEPGPGDGYDSNLESRAVRRQQALNEFERNEKFRQKLLSEAKRSGKSIPERYAPGAKKSESHGRAAIPSPFVTESLRFSQIVGEADQGWIPRLIDDRLMLLYWKRADDGRILGCSVDEKALRERIIGVLPVTLSRVRALTVVDQAGKPLFDPAPETARDWRLPFVSREISEALPRWEVAAWLADPDVITDRARTRVLTVWLLVGTLVISIMTGGFVVSRLLRSELRLAEQKTTFVANVSHELKTPLTSIRLFAEMLRDGRQKDEEKRRKYLDIMVSETERLTRLINNVLDFSRLGREGRQYSRKPVELVRLFRDLIDTQMVRLNHAGFTVEPSFGTGEAWAAVDPEAVSQALLNLLSNAEKYSPDEKWIRPALRLEDGVAVLSVADRGVGIGARDSARIFDEFYRADDSLTAGVRGTGLGLTLSRRIIEDHGGRIVYAPNVPKGSLFEVFIPLIDPPNEETES